MKPKAFSIATNSTLTTLMVVLMLAGSALAAGSRFAVIHRFDGGDGFGPVFALVADQAGNLYGLTYGNDTFPPRVFELSPPVVADGAWVETTLYTFHDIINGGAPTSSLILDQAGNLYGTARDGAFGSGVVYELSPPARLGGAWTESVLYSFQSEGSGDGALPF